MKDLRFAARLLASRPGHTATAVLALGLGIALSTTMFSLVQGIFLRGLPFDDAHRIVRLDCEKLREGIDSVQVSQRDFAAWRSQQTAFEDLAGWIGYAVKVTGPEGHAEQLTGSAASPELFDVVGVRPFLGRTFTDGEEGVALVSYRVWRDRLGGDPFRSRSVSASVSSLRRRWHGCSRPSSTTWSPGTFRSSPPVRSPWWRPASRPAGCRRGARRGSIRWSS